MQTVVSTVTLIWAPTTMFILTVGAHCPESGVNVYIVLPIPEVLIVAGSQVPLMPSIDLGGSGGATEFRQNGPTNAKVREDLRNNS